MGKMFVKKFYNLFMLFLVITCCLFSFVKGTIEIPKCGNLNSDYCSYDKDQKVVSYCWTSNSIYSLNKDGTRISYNNLNNDGISIIKLNETSITYSRSPSSFIYNNDLPYIAIVNYDIDFSNMEQASGYVKDNYSKYYTIYKTKSNSNKQVDLSGNSCSSNVGGLAKISNEVVLCLGSDRYTSLPSYSRDAGYYLIEGSTVSGSPFSVDSSTKNAVIKVTTKYFIHDEFYSSKENLYLNANTGKLLESLRGLTTNSGSASITKNLYSCENSTCSSRSASKLENGIYMMYNKLFSFENSDDGIITITEIGKNGMVLLEDFYNGDYYEISNRLVTDDELSNDLSSNLGSLKIYECKMGECVETTGYLKNYGKNDKDETEVVVYKCDSGSCKTVQKAVDCKKDNVGIASYYSESSELKVCINSGTTSDSFNQIVVTSGSSSNYLFSRNNNYFNLYISDKTGSLVGLSVTSGYYLKEKDGLEKKYNLMYCIGNTNGAECTTTNDQGYFIDSGDDNSKKLIYCDNDNCISVEEDGYFINSLTEYVIRCNTISCIIISEGASCETNNNEAIIYYDETLEKNIYKYCHNYKEISFLDSEKYYPLTDIQASSKYPTIVSGSDTILLKIDKYSVIQTINTDDEAKCITTKNELDEDCKSSGSTIYGCMSYTKTCDISENSCDPVNGTGGCYGFYLKSNTLYECREEEKDIKCNAKPNTTKGYFKVTDINELDNVGYIKCNGSTCTGLKTPTTSVRKCSSTGSLVLNSLKVKLCLGSTTMIGFSDTGNMLNYMYDGRETNIFSSTEKDGLIVLSISEDYIIPLDMSEMESNDYLINNEVYKIEKDDNNVKIEKSKLSRILAFNFEDGKGYGKLIKDEEIGNMADSAKNIKLYDCRDGECIQTIGYIKFNDNKVYKCSLTDCSTVQNSVTCSIKQCNSNDTGCDRYSDAGVGYFNGGFKICIMESLNNFKSVVIAESSYNYIMSYIYNSNRICTDNLQMNHLYLSNKAGNVIGLSKKDGNYLLKEKDKMTKCTRNINGSECYNSSNPGYYINNGIEAPLNQLIYCNGNDCSFSTNDDGYFVNSEFDSAICGSSECESFKEGSECSETSNEIILDSTGFLKYCRYNTAIDFLNVDQYYPLEKINAKNSRYPKQITSGSDTILLKISSLYSVTQYITKEGEEGICISDDNVEDKGCRISGSKKYTCPDQFEGCKVEDNLCDPKLESSSCSGYYLVDVDEKTGKGTLYECVNNEKVTCTEQPDTTRGYFKVTDLYEKEKIPYIKCNGIECVKENKPNSSADKCVEKSLGKFVTHSLTSEDKVCADKENIVGFSNDGTISHRVLNIDYEDNVFTNEINNYVLITVDYNSIIPLNLTEFEPDIYIYNNKTYSIDVDEKSNSLKIEEVQLSGMMAFTYIYSCLGKLLKNEDYIKDLSNDLNKTKLYECKNGDCAQTTGYLKHNKSTVMKCNKLNCDNKGENVLTCNNGNYGIAYYSGGKYLICNQRKQYTSSYSYTNGAYAYEITSGNRVQYIYDNYYRNLYVTDKGGNVIGLTKHDGYYLADPERDRNGDCIQCYGDTGYGNSCEMRTINNGYYMNSGLDESSNDLIYCYNGNCRISPKESGYFVKNYDWKIGIICVESFCKEYKVGTSCTFNEFEVIYDNYYGEFMYCKNSEERTMNTSYNYYPLPSINARFSSYPFVKSGANVILLVTDKYSLTQKITDEKGICIINDSESYCNSGSVKYVCTEKKKGCRISQIMSVCDPTAATPEKICNGYYLVEKMEENDLYLCEYNSKTPKCNKLPSSTRGYFKVTDSIEALKYQYIKCDGSKCEKLEISSMKDKCETVGELVYNPKIGDAYLCTDSNAYYYFDYDKTNIIYHFDTDETIFTDEKDTDIVISIYYNYMIPLDLSELSTNIYLIKNKMYLFINKGKEKYKFEKLDTTGVMAFRCFSNPIYTDINGVLIKNEEYLDDIPDVILHSIVVHQCKKGSCNSTKGYIRYNINAGEKFKIAKCDSYHCENFSTSIKNCEGSLNNIAHNESGFKLCTYIYQSSNESYYYKDIELSNGTSEMYITSLVDTLNTSYYYLFFTDKLRNVVAFNIQDGYYLLEINDHKELFICNGSICTIGTNNDGYFINTSSEELNSFIYCYHGECDYTTEDNGYFTNSLNTAWKCVSSECKLLSLSNICYSSNNYGIILNNERAFCINSKEYSFGSNSRPRYYPITVDAKSSLFPKYTNGTDTILIALDSYSATQYITNSTGIYVSYDNNRETNENEEGSTKYVCTDKNSGCNVIPNKCNPENNTGGCYGYYLSGSTLYYCNYEENNYEKIICRAQPSSTRGYFYVRDIFHHKEVPYIKCNGSTCSKMNLPTASEYYYEENQCNVDNVGKLLYTNKNKDIGICINASILTSINYGGGKQIISLDVSDNIFAKSPSSKYAMIEYSGNCIRYVDTSMVPNNTYLIDNKVISVKDGILDFVPMTQMTAFKYDNSVMTNTCYGNIMRFFTDVLVTESEYTKDLSNILSNISLYDCKNGLCIQTTGFIKHNSNNSTDIKVSECVTRCNSVKISNVNSNICSSFEVGHAYYNNKEHEFKICIKDYTDYKETVISNSKVSANYIFSYQKTIIMTCSEMPIYSLYVSSYWWKHYWFIKNRW